MSEKVAGSSEFYKWYALAVLFVVYVFNFIDRSILSILAEPIKRDMGLSDSQIGFMGGIAFAVFYTFLGIPIARLADTGVRRNILAVCLAIWSGMTAVCGYAQNFIHLLLARIGVAVGEAGGSPPSHSMISDLFPAHQRATALGIYALGIPVGTMIGNLAGGWINEAFDWRTAFMVVGIPGIIMALVVRFTLREPPRGAMEKVALEVRGNAPPVSVVFKYLWSRKSFKFMSLGAALHAFVGYGVGAWIPPMFIRSHAWNTVQIGEALFLLGFAGMLGTFTGGYFADKLAVRDVRWYVWLPGLATLISVPFAAFAYTWHDPVLALVVYAVPYVLNSYYLGPTFSMTQGLVGLRMRALAASILLFVLNLIGMGLGPWFTGILSDLLHAYTDLGAESLRWALVSVLIVNVFSAILYLIAGKDLKKDLANSHEMS
jgi:predicted MFS family arabinose efflux permease